jgi:hypothetical protein
MAEVFTEPIDDWTPILVDFHFKHPTSEYLGPRPASGIGFISPSGTTITTLQSYLRAMFQDNSFGVSEQATHSSAGGKPVKNLGKNVNLWIRWVGNGIPDTHLKTTSEVQGAFNLMGKGGWKDHLLVVSSLEGVETVSSERMGNDVKHVGRDLDKAGRSMRERDEDCELPPYRK